MPLSKNQEIARQLFLRLITLGEGTEDTRRRALQSELHSLGGDEMQAVIRAFDESRLLTFDRDPLTREPTVELAHEAIIREWSQLRTWLDESRDDVRQQRLLAAAASEWRKNNQDTSYLLSGARLAQFEDWYHKTGLALTEDEHGYLHASLEEREHRAILESERQAREKALERRAQRVLRSLVAVFLVAAVVGMSLAVYAFGQRNQAEREAAVNRSLVLAGNAEQAYEDGNTDLSLILAIEAVNLENPPSEAVTTLKQIAFAPGTMRRVDVHGGRYFMAMDITPDDRYIFSAAARHRPDSCEPNVSPNECYDYSDFELALWEVETGEVKFRFVAHSRWVNVIAINPGGTRAVSAADDGLIILWDIATGTKIDQIETDFDSVWTVTFNPIGDQLWFSGADLDEDYLPIEDVPTDIVVWDISENRVMQRIHAENAPRNLTFSSDGSTLFFSSGDSIIQWDAVNGREIKRFPILSSSFSINPDGTLLLVSGSPTISLWNIDSGEKLEQGLFTTYVSTSEQFSPDSRVAYIGSSDTLAIVDIENWEAIHVFRAIENPFRLELTSDGKTLISCGFRSAWCRILSTQDVVNQRILATVPSENWSMDLSSDGSRIVTGQPEGRLIVFDTVTGNELYRIINPEYLQPFGVRFAFNGPYVVTSSINLSGIYETANNFILWNLVTGLPVYSLIRPEDADVIKNPEPIGGHPFRIAVNREGNLAVAGTFNDASPRELLVWDLRTGEIRHRTPYLGGEVHGIMDTAISSNNRYYVAAYDSPRYLILWDMETGEGIRRFEGGHTDQRIERVRFTSDNRFILSAGSDGKMILWDVETGEIIRTYLGHGESIWGLDISLDDRYIVSGGPTSITLWDFASGDILHQLNQGTIELEFSPDGRTVYYVNTEQQVIAWEITDFSLDEALTWIRDNRYIRPITLEECAEYPLVSACNDID